MRAIIPDALPTADLFLPLADGFAKYPAASFELVIGAATGSDFTAKTVTVTIPGNAEPRTIAYDQLVLATGSRAAAIGPDGKTPLPFKAWGTHEEAAAALDALRERVSAARHVVVAGAGGTGVELAAELGFAFSQPKVKPEARKEVVLLSAGDTLLNGDYLAGPAETELKKLGVQIKKGATVTGTTVKEGGKTAVALSNGETIETDLYLPTFGLIPNSEFVDAKYKRDGGYLVVDEFLRVKDAGDVWAAGDLVSLPRAGYLITEKQVCMPVCPCSHLSALQSKDNADHDRT